MLFYIQYEKLQNRNRVFACKIINTAWNCILYTIFNTIPYVFKFNSYKLTLRVHLKKDRDDIPFLNYLHPSFLYTISGFPC